MMRDGKSKKIQKYSYGVLLFTGCGNDRRYLLIQNRDTEAFIYFFLAWNMERWTDNYLLRVLRGFSRDELNRLLFYPFDILYTDLYVNHKKGTFVKQYERARSNYHFFHSRPEWIKMCHSIGTTEIGWGFSKGRIERGETEAECALRELEEETGIDAQQVAIRSDLPTIQYVNEKSLFHTAVHVCLFPTESKTVIPIHYQKFDHTIRCESVSNEILHARWVRLEEALFLLPSTLYRILYEFHLSLPNELI